MPSLAPHRCYVSVELPFCLPVTTNTTAAAATTTTTAKTPHSRSRALQEVERRSVEAFVPPSFLRPCLDDVAVAESKETGTPADGTTVKKRSRESTSGIATPSEYYADEVFSGWRPLDFGDDADGGSARGTDLAKEERERMLRESFPSFTPQVLLQGFYRNDALVEVTCTRRLRRMRDGVTGRVVEETYLPSGDADAGVENQTEATVVGIVSREVNIVRPADFTYTPFSKDQVAAAPLRCSANLFPPSHFVPEKTPFEVECEFGTRSVGKARGPSDGVACVGEDELPTQWEFEGMPTLSLRANDPSIPPSMLPAQRDYLYRLNGGEGEEDCVEVRTVKQLLEERPAWIAEDLHNAIFQSGVCPRMHINKKAMSCLTYIIQNGPFNRLRIRLGFDPYATYAAASLQRIAVKINRRSEIGTLLRDISRVPDIADLMRDILKTHAERRQTQKKKKGARSRDACIPYRTRGSFLERLAKVIHGGQLYMAMQLCDLVDDDDDDNNTFIKEMLARLPSTGAAVIPLEKRSGRNGWIGEECYQRAVSYITEAIFKFIREEVEPALVARQRKGGGPSLRGKGFEQRSPCTSSPSCPSTVTSSSSSFGLPSNSDDDDDDDAAASIGSVGTAAVSSLGDETD